MIAAALGALIFLQFGIIGIQSLEAKKKAVSEAVHTESFLPCIPEDILKPNEALEQNESGLDRQSGEIIVSDRIVESTLMARRCLHDCSADHDRHRQAKLLRIVYRNWRQAAVVQYDRTFSQYAFYYCGGSPKINHCEWNSWISILVASPFDPVGNDEEPRPLSGNFGLTRCFGGTCLYFCGAGLVLGRSGQSFVALDKLVGLSAGFAHFMPLEAGNEGAQYSDENQRGSESCYRPCGLRERRLIGSVLGVLSLLIGFFCACRSGDHSYGGGLEKSLPKEALWFLLSLLFGGAGVELLAATFQS